MLIVGGASVWGLMWLPLRYAESRGVDGAFAVLAAFLWPALAMLPLLWRDRARLCHFTRPCLAFGAFAGCGFALYALGLVYSGVVRVTLLFYLAPVWSALLAMWLLGERTGPRGWLAAGIGLGGMGLVLGANDSVATPLNVGDAMALASGVLWSFGVLVLRRTPETPPLGTVTAQYLFAALCALVALLLRNPDGLADQAAAWVSASLPLGLYATVVLMPGLFGVFWAAGRLPPARVGILMMSEVLVAAVSASLLTDERLGTWQWAGAGLIVAAAVLEVTGREPGAGSGRILGPGPTAPNEDRRDA